MAEITKLQLKILEDLYQRDIGNQISIRIQPEFYDLSEKDEIMRVRELVAQVEYLRSVDLVDVKEPFYLGSDPISMDYLNNAVEIHDRRVKLSNLGIQYVDALKTGLFTKLTSNFKKSFNKFFSDHPLRVMVTHVSAFLLGMLVMWFILNFFEGV